MSQEGYIYILANKSMPGLLKVGKTKRTPEQRAKELQSSGVPTPFIVVHKRKVTDINKAEKEAHSKLHRYRANTKREFFKISEHKAILIVNKACNKYKKRHFWEKDQTNPDKQHSSTKNQTSEEDVAEGEQLEYAGIRNKKRADQKRVEEKRKQIQQERDEDTESERMQIEEKKKKDQQRNHKQNGLTNEKTGAFLGLWLVNFFTLVGTPYQGWTRAIILIAGFFLSGFIAVCVLDKYSKVAGDENIESLDENAGCTWILTFSILSIFFKVAGDKKIESLHENPGCYWIILFVFNSFLISGAVLYFTNNVASIGIAESTALMLGTAGVFAISTVALILRRSKNVRQPFFDTQLMLFHLTQMAFIVGFVIIIAIELLSGL